MYATIHRSKVWHVLLAATCVWLGSVLESTACSIPVFRYALERWSADWYELDISTGASCRPKTVVCWRHSKIVALRYAIARQRAAAGELGQILSMYARRNIPGARSATVLEKIGPLLGDGIHDTDLMLWISGGRIESVYALTKTSGAFPPARPFASTSNWRLSARRVPFTSTAAI
jgi:hypothetical protein